MKGNSGLKDNFFNYKKVWFKLVAITLAGIFLFNDISYSLQATSRLAPGVGQEDPSQAITDFQTQTLTAFLNLKIREFLREPQNRALSPEGYKTYITIRLRDALKDNIDIDTSGFIWDEIDVRDGCVLIPRREEDETITILKFAIDEDNREHLLTIRLPRAKDKEAVGQMTGSPSEAAPTAIVLQNLDPEGPAEITLQPVKMINKIGLEAYRVKVPGHKTDPLNKEFNVGIVVNRNSGELQIRVMDLGEDPPPGVALTIANWASYRAKTLGYWLVNYGTYNPRMLSLFAKVTDYKIWKKLLERGFWICAVDHKPKVNYDAAKEKYDIDISGGAKIEIEEDEVVASNWEGLPKGTHLEDLDILQDCRIVLKSTGKVVGRLMRLPYYMEIMANPKPIDETKLGSGPMALSLRVETPLKGKQDQYKRILYLSARELGWPYKKVGNSVIEEAQLLTRLRQTFPDAKIEALVYYPRLFEDMFSSDGNMEFYHREKDLVGWERLDDPEGPRWDLVIDRSKYFTPVIERFLKGYVYERLQINFGFPVMLDTFRDREGRTFEIKDDSLTSEVTPSFIYEAFSRKLNAIGLGGGETVVPELRPSKKIKTLVEKDIQKALGSRPPKPIILINPHSDIAGPWPIENWVALIERIAKTHDVHMVISHGGNGYEELAYQDILKRIDPTLKDKIIELPTYDYDLASFFALMSCAKLCITINSAPLHLAATLRVPTIVLSDASSHGWTPPISGIFEIVKEKTNEITVDEVMDKLGRGPGLPPALVFNKDYPTVKSILEHFLQIIQESEPEAKALVRNPDFLRSLNQVILNTDEMTAAGISQPDIYELKKILNSIMRHIFQNGTLSQELAAGLGLFNPSQKQDATLAFADKRTAKSLKTDFNEIIELLNDADKTTNLILLLSMLRRVCDYIPNPRETGSLTPLEAAIQTKSYISLGNGLYIAPISESFRRHIVFKMDDKGNVSQAIELFIPGEKKNKRHSLITNRLDKSQEMRDFFGENSGVVKTLLMAEYPKEVTTHAYGEISQYTEGAPLRVFVYDHSPKVRGRRLIDIFERIRVDKAYLERLENAPTSRTILKDILTIINHFIALGYDCGNDLHLENFRLCLDGRIRYVGDFDAFHVPPQIGPQKNLRDKGLSEQNMRYLEQLVTSITDEKIDYNAVYKEILDEVITAESAERKRAFRRIRSLRRLDELTIEEVAKGSGFEEAYIAAIEEGKVVPTRRELEKIGDFLEVPPYFFTMTWYDSFPTRLRNVLDNHEIKRYKITSPDHPSEDHPSDGAPRRPAVVAFVLRRDADGKYSVLLTKRARRLPYLRGNWVLPGGKREVDAKRKDGLELISTCALREIEEETGIERVKENILGRWDDAPTKNGKFNIAPVIVLVSHDTTFTETPEAEREYWLPLERLTEKDIFKRLQKRRGKKEGINVDRRTQLILRQLSKIVQLAALGRGADLPPPAKVIKKDLQGSVFDIVERKKRSDEELAVLETRRDIAVAGSLSIDVVDIDARAHTKEAVIARAKDAPYLAVCYLSTCVGCVLYDEKAKVGSILHLDVSTDVTRALDEAIEDMTKLGADRSNLKAWVLGGKETIQSKSLLLDVIEFLNKEKVNTQGMDILDPIFVKNAILDLETGRIFRVIAPNGVNLDLLTTVATGSLHIFDELPASFISQLRLNIQRITETQDASLKSWMNAAIMNEIYNLWQRIYIVEATIGGTLEAVIEREKIVAETIENLKRIGDMPPGDTPKGPAIGGGPNLAKILLWTIGISIGSALAAPAKSFALELSQKVAEATVQTMQNSSGLGWGIFAVGAVAALLLFPELFKKFKERFYGKTRESNKATQGSGIEDLVIWDRKYGPHPFLFQDDMRTSSAYSPASFYEGLNRFLAGNVTRKFRHLYSYLSKNFFFMRLSMFFGAFIQNFKTCLYSIFNIVYSFVDGFSLRDTAWNGRTLDNIARYNTGPNNYFIFHNNHPSSRENYTVFSFKRQVQALVGIGALYYFGQPFGREEVLLCFSPLFILMGVFDWTSGINEDDFSKIADKIDSGGIGMEEAVELLKRADYPEIIERAIWRRLGSASYEDTMVVLRMARKTAGDRLETLSEGFISQLFSGALKTIKGWVSKGKKERETRDDKAILSASRLFSRVIDRLRDLALKGKEDIPEKAVDTLIEVSDKAAGCMLSTFEKLAVSDTLSKELKIKIQRQLFFNIACNISRPKVSTDAENVVRSIGFDNFEYEVLVDIYLSGIFNKKYRSIFPERSDALRFDSALRNGIDKLMPSQIPTLHQKIKDDFAGRIARRLETLCRNKETQEEASSVLLKFNDEYPLESLRPIARLALDKDLDVEFRIRLQKRIIDLHFHRRHEVKTALKENRALIDYNEFDFESLVYAELKNIQSPAIKTGLVKKVKELFLKEIELLDPKIKEKFKGSIATRLGELVLEDKEGALEALLDFSKIYGFYTYRYFQTILKKYENNPKRTAYTLEKLIDLNFLAENRESCVFIGKTIEAYGVSNIPLTLLFYASRDERFKGGEQAKYLKALAAKFLPLKIDEILEAMRLETNVVTLPNVLATIAEKIEPAPASVSLIQFANSKNVEERLAAMEALYLMLKRKKLSPDIRKSIEGFLIQIAIEEPNQEVKGKSREVIKSFGLANLLLETLLYAYEQGKVEDEFIQQIEKVLIAKITAFPRVEDIFNFIKEHKRFAGILIAHLAERISTKGDIKAFTLLRELENDGEIALNDRLAALDWLCITAANKGFDMEKLRNPALELAIDLVSQLNDKKKTEEIGARTNAALEKTLLDTNAPLDVRTELLKYFTRNKEEIVRRKEFLRNLLARAPDKVLDASEISYYDAIVKATKLFLDPESLPVLFKLYETNPDPKFRRHIVQNIGLIRYAAKSRDKLLKYLEEAIRQNADERLIKELVWANGEIANEKAEKLVLVLLNDNKRSADLRKAAAKALGNISGSRDVVENVKSIALVLAWDEEFIEEVRSGIEYKASWKATQDEKTAELLDEVYLLYKEGKLEEVFGKEAQDLAGHLKTVEQGIGGRKIALYLPKNRYIVRGVQTTKAVEDVLKRGVQSPLTGGHDSYYASQEEYYFSRTLKYVLGGFTSENGALMFIPSEFYNEELALDHVALGKREQAHVDIFVFNRGVPREKIKFIFVDTKLFKDIERIKKGEQGRHLNMTQQELADFDLIDSEKITDEAIRDAISTGRTKIIEVKREEAGWHSFEDAVRRLVDSEPLKNYLKRPEEKRLEELTIKGYAQRWLTDKGINAGWWHQLAVGGRILAELEDLKNVPSGSHAVKRGKHKKTGKHYYVKYLDDVDQLRAEYVAWRFYKELGFNVAKEMYLTRGLIEGKAKWCLITREIKGFKEGLNDKLKSDRLVVERYLADVWLQNGDAPKPDNNGVDSEGRPVALDFGGAINCRAWEKKRKEFTLTSMKAYIDGFFDPALNRTDPTFYHHATYEDKINSARRIAQLSDEIIKEVVYSAGYTDAALRSSIIKTLIDGKYYLMSKFNVGGQESMEALYDLFGGTDEEFAVKIKQFNRFVPFELKELMSRPSGRSKGDGSTKDATIWDHTMIALKRLDTDVIASPDQGRGEAISTIDLRRILRAVVFMHDIGKAAGRKDHDVVSMRLAQKYLPQMGFSKEEVYIALEIMYKNKFGSLLNEKIPSSERISPQDFAKLLMPSRVTTSLITKRELFSMVLAYYMADITAGETLKEVLTERDADGRRYLKESLKDFYRLLEILEREEQERLLNKTYTGVMFDIDGTITEEGELDRSVLIRIADLLRKKTFVAFATGRQGNEKEVSSLIRALEMVGVGDKELAYLRIFTDNGARCFFGNSELDTKYLREWPKDYPKETAKKFFESLLKKLKDCEVKEREIGLRIKTKNVNAFLLARELGKKIRGLKLPLEVAASGKNSIDILPLEANKKEALEYFKQSISEWTDTRLEAIKILAIGNRGEPEGNDYPMLVESGFTVGGKRKDSLVPPRVYKGTGSVLTGSDAAVWLLENAKFKSPEIDPLKAEILEVAAKVQKYEAEKRALLESEGDKEAQLEGPRDPTKGPTGPSSTGPKLASVLFLTTCFSIGAALAAPARSSAEELSQKVSETAVQTVQNLSSLGWGGIAAIISVFLLLGLIVYASSLFSRDKKRIGEEPLSESRTVSSIFGLGRREYTEPELEQLSGKIRKDEITIKEGLRILVNSRHSNIIKKALEERIINAASFDEVKFVLASRESLLEPVLKRLEILALTGGIQDKRNAINEIIEISGQSGEASIFEYLNLTRLCTAVEIPQDARAKLQIRLLKIALWSGRPVIAFEAEKVLLNIGFNKMEFETLTAFSEFDVFSEDAPSTRFKTPEHKYSFEGELERGIDKLTSAQIRDLPKKIKDTFAANITKRLEHLIAAENDEEAVDGLIAFNWAYPAVSFETIGRLSTDGKLKVPLRNKLQQRIIAIHMHGSQMQKSILRDNEASVNYERFELKNLVFAVDNGVKSSRIKTALLEKFKSLSLEDIINLDKGMRLRLKADIVRRLYVFIIKGKQGALEEFLNFSEEAGRYAARYLSDILVRFSIDINKTHAILKRLIELNFLAKTDEDCAAFGKVIEAYGASNIPLELLLYAIRDERFKGPEQKKYINALGQKFHPIEIKEVLEEMRSITKILELIKILDVIAKKISVGPASVCLVQFAQSDNPEERLASIEPLHIVFQRTRLLGKEVVETIQKPIEIQLVHFLVNDPNEEVRLKAKEIFKHLKLSYLTLETLLYLYSEVDRVGELAGPAAVELEIRLSRFNNVDELVRLIKTHIQRHRKGISIPMRRLAALAAKGDEKAVLELRGLIDDEKIILSDKVPIIQPLSLSLRRSTAELISKVVKELGYASKAKILTRGAVRDLEEALSNERIHIIIRTKLLEYFIRNKAIILEKKKLFRNLLAHAPPRILAKEEVFFYFTLIRILELFKDPDTLPELSKVQQKTQDITLKRRLERSITIIRGSSGTSGREIRPRREGASLVYFSVAVIIGALLVLSRCDAFLVYAAIIAATAVQTMQNSSGLGWGIFAAGIAAALFLFLGLFVYMRNFKNLPGVSILIPWYGLRTKRSLSPVTIQSAPASSAHSKMMLSLGSLQSRSFFRVFIKTASRLKRCSSLIMSSLVKYFSKRGLDNVSNNSSSIECDRTGTNLPSTKASYNLAEVEPPISALMKTLVSTTAKSSFITALSKRLTNAFYFFYRNRLIHKPLTNLVNKRRPSFSAGIFFKFLHKLYLFLWFEPVNGLLELLHVYFYRNTRHLYHPHDEYILQPYKSQARNYTPPSLEISIGNSLYFAGGPLMIVLAMLSWRDAFKKSGSGRGKIRLKDLKIIRKLAEGGESIIYLAKDEDGNKYTLRTIRGWEGTKGNYARLKELVTIYKRINPDGKRNDLPYLVNVDFNDERKLVFIYRYNAGERLTLFRDSPDDLARLPQILLSLAKILGYVHKSGITHCDIKPDNVLVTNSEEVSLIDFGCAAIRKKGGERVLRGTQFYISPQQGEKGHPQPVDDIFSFGVTIYEMLLKKEYREVRSFTKDIPANFVRRRGWRKMVKERTIESPLRPIMLKCLQFDPKKRYQSAEELAKALERLLKKETTQSPIVSPPRTPRTDGFVRQGEKSWRIFQSRLDEYRKNDITDQYRDRMIALLSSFLRKQESIKGNEIPASAGMTEVEQRLRAEIERLKKYKIYGFESIVEAPNDFVLDWNNAEVEEPELFLATDVIEELQNHGPPGIGDVLSRASPKTGGSSSSLLDEYLLHTILCGALGHKEAIKLQQKLFENHYENTTDEPELVGEYQVKDGVKYKVDRKGRITDDLLKGLLGNELRRIINWKATEFVQATLADLDVALRVHNEAWLERADNEHLKLTPELMKNLIEAKLIYLLKIKGVNNPVRGVLCTHRLRTEGNLSKIHERPLWNNMIHARLEDKDPDTVLFWAIGSIIRKDASREINLGRIFVQKAKAHLKGDKFKYKATFSPISEKDFGAFRRILEKKKLGESLIKKFGIYLYLLSFREGGYEEFIEQVYKRPKPVSLREIFLEKHGRKLRDDVANFHVAKGGATIAKVLPQKEGYTRPDGLYTAIYGYEGFTEDKRAFRKLQSSLKNLKRIGLPPVAGLPTRYLIQQAIKELQDEQKLADSPPKDKIQEMIERFDPYLHEFSDDKLIEYIKRYILGEEIDLSKLIIPEEPRKKEELESVSTIDVTRVFKSSFVEKTAGPTRRIVVNIADNVPQQVILNMKSTFFDEILEQLEKDIKGDETSNIVLNVRIEDNQLVLELRDINGTLSFSALKKLLKERAARKEVLDWGDGSVVLTDSRKCIKRLIREEINCRLKGALEISDDIKAPSKLRIPISKHGQDAQALIDALILARDAKKAQGKIIIGLDTSWIPAKDGLQELISAISKLSEPLGMGNIIIVRGEGQNLADEITRKIDEYREKGIEILDSNIVVLGSKDTITSEGFKRFNPFFIEINPEELKKEAPTNKCNFIMLVKMLEMALRVAFLDIEIKSIDITGLKGEQKSQREWLFTPKAVPIDIEEAPQIYRLQAELIDSAA